MIFKVLLDLCKAVMGVDKLFVYLDPADNSITLSKALFKHIQENADKNGKPSVFVFRVRGANLFGFMLEHNIKQPTQLCTIQYNEKYKCVGFETLNPSVGRILYEYGLPAEKKCRLSVSVERTYSKTFYQLNND